MIENTKIYECYKKCRIGKDVKIDEVSNKVKQLDSKFNSDEYQYMYSTLQDVVIDSINVDKKLLNQWKFDNVKVLKKTVTGSTAIITFDTPDGKFDIKVEANII